jgi:uncharacterized protein YlzI (FlbEa/FlbD family)
MKTLIIGAGEIGKSLYNVLNKKYETYIKDTEPLDLEGVKVMHIAIPYSDKFVEIVKEYQVAYKPIFTIIHSTVPMGVTRELDAFNSPVRGIHPHLEKSLKTFVKYLAPHNELLVKYFKDAGIKIKTVDKPETTEAMKLWCTTQYGINVIVEKEIKKYCEENDVDFNIVYKDCNETYNKGYEKLGFPKFKKYTLDHMDGECGGHCIQNNAVLLYESGQRGSIEYLLSGGQNTGKDNPLNRKDWLFCEYIGKKKSTIEIGKELGYTGEWVAKQLNKFNIPIRDRKWRDEEIEKTKKLYESGLSFKEISKEFDDRTYNSIRNVAYKTLKIESNYNPAIRDEKTKIKISASLQGIDEKDWNGFKEDINSLIRKSKEYQNWRKQVFERDKYTCQECGAKSGNGKKIYLHAHHIKEFSKYPEKRFNLDNGKTLCVDCHHKQHSKNKKYTLCNGKCIVCKNDKCIKRK